MGNSRDRFFQFEKMYDKGGEEALQEIGRRKSNTENRTMPDVENAVVRTAVDQPAWGQIRTSDTLRRRALPISRAGVRCVWQRHALKAMNKRLKALEAKQAQDGMILTKAQVVALESG